MSAYLCMQVFWFWRALHKLVATDYHIHVHTAHKVVKTLSSFRERVNNSTKNTFIDLVFVFIF